MGEILARVLKSTLLALFSGMHGTPGRAAHLARMLMMVALLPRGLIGGLRISPQPAEQVDDVENADVLMAQ